jgi:choice-of-anchor A domain-containing protein
MRITILALVALAIIATASAINVGKRGGNEADSYLLGPAHNYNIFLLGSKHRHLDLVADNGDSEGPVAVNGGFKASTFGIITRGKYTCVNNNQYTLLVNGDLEYQNGELSCGRYLVSGTVIKAPSLAPGGSGQTGDIKQKSGLDFVAAGTHLNGVNHDLCASNDYYHAQITQWGAITFKGNSKDDVQVFHIPASDFDGATSANFEGVKPGALVIVNVVGSSAHISNFQTFTNGIPPENLFWNFCGTMSLDIHNFQFLGSILAPRAHVVLENTEIKGTLVASSARFKNSAEVHWYPFTGVDCA